MSTKKYHLSQEWGDLTVTVQVDHDVLTPELAAEINAFWGGAEGRLDAADDDAVMAVVKLIGARFMRLLMEHDSVPWAQQELDKSEGFPPDGGHGVTLLDFDGLPEINSEELEVLELEA